MQNRAAQLEKQIKVLIDDSVALLKARMSELGINATSPGDLLAKAKEIVCRHKDLQAKASKLQGQVSNLEQDQRNLVLQRQQEITEKYTKQDPNREISPRIAEECILREISSTLSHRKKLHTQVSLLEGEVMSLEKSSEERKQAQAATRQQQPSSKALRKSRDYRARSQDWPDVPDIAKIEEQNPEILAQKILEKGRMIEASKLSANCNKFSSNKPLYQNNQKVLPARNNNMPAPSPVTKRSKVSNYPNLMANQKLQEPPRIANFEDRLKSIITSVLNEDQHNRVKNQSSQIYNHVGSNQYQVQCAFTNQQISKIEEKKYVKYSRCETIVRPAEESTRNYMHVQDTLTNPLECYRELEATRSITSIKQTASEQPDYTQVSPAKLALRRHLSQEKLAAQHQFNHQEVVATRTIGDLMSGEIERTLEISNQSIINAAVDMSDIQGTTTLTSRSVVNANMPPRPERVNVKAPNSEAFPAKESENIMRQVYSPISRPSSADGLEGLAFIHPHAKVSNHSINQYISPASASPRQSQFSPRTTILYPTQPRPGPICSNYSQNEHYTPLPRADIKPYHESYFNDVKPVLNEDTHTQNNFVPEGLAASLQARVLNGPHIKEEIDPYERRGYAHPSIVPNLPAYQSGSIKTESLNNECQYKRESPVIQGPIRSSLVRSTIYIAESQRSSFQNITSPEPHSNTSTPLVDEVLEVQSVRKPQEEGK